MNILKLLHFLNRLNNDDVSESEGLLNDSSVATVRLSIVGMTCQSCVRNIEGTIKTKLGVHKIKVVLAENAGYIDYDPQLTDPKQLANDIDDMGFECAYPNETNAAQEETQLAECRIQIVGMTCQSCVRNIEGTISKAKGCQSIVVNLEQKEACVSYDARVTSPRELADQIDDMGFEATVTSTSVLTDSDKIPKTDKQLNGKY